MTSVETSIRPRGNSSGKNVRAQAPRILESCRVMLHSVGSDLVIGVNELPKSGILLTMNLTAVAKG